MELQSLSLLLLLLALLFGALYWFAQQRHRSRIGSERGRLWEDCVSLLDGARVRQDGIDFPRLEGYYHGRRVTLEAIADHIAFRKLPQLWLRATLREDIPHRGILDLLVRPENIEFYSPIWSLPETIDLPPGWPAHALVRTDCAGEIPPLGVVGRHLGIFDDPRTKELLVTPRGVRLVYQLAQGQRAHYAVLRSVNFELSRADPDEVGRILDAALAISNDLRAAGSRDTPNSPIPRDTTAMPWPVLKALGTPC
jgi:hypothetical protein